ncbi:hypothetical protein [Methylorubrum aminovorans]|uniref:hypothetical protein n=1 Tax=Methylorubrum aminovorans TaxID=269069 RepID=UPI003C2F220A
MFAVIHLASLCSSVTIVWSGSEPPPDTIPRQPVRHAMTKVRTRPMPILPSEMDTNRSALAAMKQETPLPPPERMTTAKAVAELAPEIRALLKAGHSLDEIAKAPALRRTRAERAAAAALPQPLPDARGQEEERSQDKRDAAHAPGCDSNPDAGCTDGRSVEPWCERADEPAITEHVRARDGGGRLGCRR